MKSSSKSHSHSSLSRFLFVIYYEPTNIFFFGNSIIIFLFFPMGLTWFLNWFLAWLFISLNNNLCNFFCWIFTVIKHFMFLLVWICLYFILILEELFSLLFCILWICMYVRVSSVCWVSHWLWLLNIWTHIFYPFWWNSQKMSIWTLLLLHFL